MKFLEAAKAYVALIGAVTSALLGVFTADTPVGQVLTVIAVVATAFVTYRVPNADAQPTPASPEGGGFRYDERGATNVLYGLGALLVAVAVLLLITTLLKVFVVSIPLLIVVAIVGVVLVVLGGRTAGRNVL